MCPLSNMPYTILLFAAIFKRPSSSTASYRTSYRFADRGFAQVGRAYGKFYAWGCLYVCVGVVLLKLGLERMLGRCKLVA